MSNSNLCWSNRIGGTMLRLSFHAKQATGSGEILSATAQRLVRWGMSEREAYALAQINNLHAETPDKTVE